MTMHFSKVAQIATLKRDKASTKVPPKYTDHAYVFSFDLAIELPENTGINEHVIKLHEGKKLPYKPIYSLRLVELETLKTYIKTHLKTGFIQTCKSPAGALSLFDNKPDNSFCLCVDYQGFNNLTIKNQYLQPFISDAWEWLSKAKKFTLLNLTSAYYQMRIKKGDE